MKSGATESSFYYLSQYYTIPQEVHISRSLEELIQSSHSIKILWAHDNCDQVQFANLPELSSQLDKIVCVSNWEREQYIKYKRAPAEKLIVIPNGIADFFVPPTNPKSKTAIFFSAPHKGIVPLPKIWKQVIKNHPDAKLKVFSSMSLYENAKMNVPEKPEFIEAIEELKTLPNVEYSPCIEREQLLSHIQDAAFFIHPNVWEETFCVSLAEAMACGCFPIMSDIGALPETSFRRGKYVPMIGENSSEGWKPSPKFINEFAQEVSRAFDFFDKEPQTFYAATKDLSQVTKETYDWKKIAKVWENLIGELNPNQSNEQVDFDNRWDYYIYNEVSVRNEYNISQFSPQDIVIDIGAHKGYFAKFCLDNGCKHIHCFEPEPKNYERLVSRLKDCKYVQTYNIAVLDGVGKKDFLIVPGENTGLHSFYQTKIAESSIKVITVGLDDILSKFKRVSLIKIDTEGSEYEILMNSKLLHKVDRIVGEYHDDLTDKSMKDLSEYLEKQNFSVVLKKDKSIFFAEKRKGRKKYFCMINTKKSQKYTYKALESFARNTHLDKDDKFFLIDNDGTFDSSIEGVNLITNETPKSFAENVNQILSQTIQDEADFVMMNNDIILSSNWLEPLITTNSITVPLCNQHIQEKVGNFELFSVMELDQYLGNEKEFENIAAKITEKDLKFEQPKLIPFYCFYLPYEVSSEVGLFDEEYGKGGGEDVDYRIRSSVKGYDTKLVSKSYILHFLGKSTWRGAETKQETKERHMRYYRHFSNKWGEENAKDLLTSPET